MSSLDELDGTFTRDDEERITRTVEKFRQRISAAIGHEMLLTITPVKARNRPGARYEIDVMDWHESPLFARLRQGEATLVQLLLDIHRGDIARLARSSGEVERLLERISHHDSNFEPASRQNRDVLRRAGEIADELLQNAALAGTLELMREIDRDIFGTYRPIDNGKGEVQLYWQAISLGSRQLGVPIEDLTVVVLLHEVTHAYTHLGYDNTNRSFYFDRFCHPDNRAALESLAQFYTERVAEKWHDTDGNGISVAFEKLLECQHELYHGHVGWRDEYDLEVIRTALLKLREQSAPSTEGTFGAVLDATRAHMNRRWLSS